MIHVYNPADGALVGQAPELTGAEVLVSVSTSSASAASCCAAGSS